MDSDDSRGASSENESTHKSNRSVGSRSRSGSRSVSSCSVSNKSDHSSRSHSSENGRSRSASSGSEISETRSRPHSPKSPTGQILNNHPRSASNSPKGSIDRKWDSRKSESPKNSNQIPERNITNSPNCDDKNQGSRSPSSDIGDNERRSRPRSPVNSENSSRSSSRGSSPPTKKESDKNSVKSESSVSSKRSGRSSRTSGRSSKMSKTSKRSSRKKSEGNTSDSSSSSAESSSRKHISGNADIEPEEISDGDIESEYEKEQPKELSKPHSEINISHEDLSDVSDLEDSLGHSDDDKDANIETASEVKQQQNEIEQKRAETDVQRVTDKNCKNEPEEGEEQLDFEAEDGECGEVEETKQKVTDIQVEPLEDGEMEAESVEKEKKETKKKEDLEEGEVSDEDEVRPEETEPRPVCRFFSRGQCTWGASCRFLHPGVTDKGNYTMFEMVHPLVPGEYSGGDRYAARPDPAPIESAWERGLRTAKEMLRKSIKRKEQDIDFEEKKMNLSLAQEEFDKENGYYGRVPSPEPRFVSRHPPVEYPAPSRPPVPPDEYYNRRQVVYEPPEYAPRERVRPAYRELPTHKMPDYYNNKYEEESSGKRKPKREVIVHRAEREREREREDRPSRADDWSDPWMRSKSPAGKRSGRKRSYSSGSSYSSSSSTRTSTSRSSYRSRSRSVPRKRRRSRSKKSRHVSPSVIVSERKAANERAAMMNPPAPRKRAPSPGMIRAVTAANPPAPADQFGRTRSKLVAALARARGKRRSSRSSSDSSGSSSSDSESSASSSSSSRDGSPAPKRPGELSLAKAMDALKGNSAEKRQIKLNLKTPLSSRKPELAELARKVDQAQSKKRPAISPPPGDPKNKKAASRREELLKQLKAVEDAIAKKRSKVN
ncbi:zinc finger CCCH domain-containing protein 18-like isoform X2 [Harmonia axyridis]|uniref:zinc finger CCCH domain-containing protein 18-like isoform X2 n=1 Tax=Harmonia axyridis TaxID=115357 RepID=UPI001E277405|nr:zinc finger CCCH domain-containing protein 18-like isoform X2 [Harmonia axyridis]